MAHEKVDGPMGSNHEARLHQSRPRYRFRPLNVGRWVIWGLFALLLIVAPMIWTSGFALTNMSQMGNPIVA